MLKAKSLFFIFYFWGVSCILAQPSIELRSACTLSLNDNISKLFKDNKFISDKKIKELGLTKGYHYLDSQDILNIIYNFKITNNHIKIKGNGIHLYITPTLKKINKSSKVNPKLNLEEKNQQTSSEKKIIRYYVISQKFKNLKKIPKFTPIKLIENRNNFNLTLNGYLLKDFISPSQIKIKLLHSDKHIIEYVDQSNLIFY